MYKGSEIAIRISGGENIVDGRAAIRVDKLGVRLFYLEG